MWEITKQSDSMVRDLVVLAGLASLGQRVAVFLDGR